MFRKEIKFELPFPPWEKGLFFETTQLGYINYLVGANGSGKSRFAVSLKNYLKHEVRFLSTDRLAGMEQLNPTRNLWGEHFESGYAKNLFSRLKSIGKDDGSGIDTVIILEERVDLRIQIEATLSQLFRRKIRLEWDSGNLVANASLEKTGKTYRLDRHECHGIKELLVLLTNLYNNEYKYLIIDEPELNLHPQYQAFFMQEVRKFAGDPSQGKKIIFLVTHSPFILDFRTVEDVKSVISFKSDFSKPCNILELEEHRSSAIASLIPRLNVHHKQLFFSDNPVFVEGIFDAQLVASIQDARGTSVAGAGSCIIDVGGCEEINKYLVLCRLFDKKAHFLYDLDSLFFGNLRSCLNDDGSIKGFLADAGVGSDFSKYCGELDRKLSDFVVFLLEDACSLPCIASLKYFLSKLPSTREDWQKEHWRRARVAVMTAISKYSDEMKPQYGVQISEIEGRIKRITETLKQKNINLLPGGTIERYLPSYCGDEYNLDDESKRHAIESEIELISHMSDYSEFSSRYNDLYKSICNLPSNPEVDPFPVVKEYLGCYIHELQRIIVNNPGFSEKAIQEQLNAQQHHMAKIFAIRDFTRNPACSAKFQVKISIIELLGHGKKYVLVTEKTNAGMGDFIIESE